MTCSDIGMVKGVAMFFGMWLVGIIPLLILYKNLGVFGNSCG
ncbi:MAG: hypothetical protein P857_859 [Candidatus Xenolissoclinum pacificiensis L6]|uniref:Uncharacterized protein n=1 Tax=Candidatus Xenolissoclinum pacificiensis L6 TaxID=1401685 RepID=W2V2N2_9RICK|nr:MAG: hypothetical protein P857_859 [Candidatus Xenolissoclinum pacificiensis L6]